MSLDLSFQEVEELLESIVNNKKLTKVQSRNKVIFVVFSHPSSQDILLSRHVRETTLIETEEMGLPSAEDTAKIVEKKGVFTDEDRDKIERLQEKLTAQNRILQLTKIEGRRKPVLANIEKIEKEIAEVESKKDSYYVLSREYKADEASLLFLSWAATYNLDGSRFWSSFEDFEDEKDLTLRTSVVNNYSKFNSGLDVSYIRHIARHTLWRIRYSTALKTGGSLFPGGLHDLTTDQQSLLYWSNYYQSIYEMLPDERPDDDIIDDDDELDKFMDVYFKRREQDRNQGRLNRHSQGSDKLSAAEGQEVIITQAHPEYMKMVYSEERIKSKDGSSEVEVLNPHSKRVRDRFRR